MDIFFVRHTEYENPLKIYPYRLPFILSKEGRLHAKNIGNWLRDNKYIGLPIYTSPIVRTLQTAEIIAALTNSKIYKEENLIEFTWNKQQGESIPKHNDWSQFYKPGLQEPAKSILERTKKVFDKIVKGGIDSIALSHGDNITLLYYFLLNQPAPVLYKSKFYIEKGEILFIRLNKNKKISLKRIKLNNERLF